MTGSGGQTSAEKTVAARDAKAVGGSRLDGWDSCSYDEMFSEA